MMNEETPFEKELSGFEREPLPADWREDIISASEASIHEVPSETPWFGPVTKAGLGAIAACWVVIIGLQLTTPAAQKPEQLASRFGIEERYLPLLAQRIGGVAVGSSLIDSLKLNLVDES